MLAGPSPAGIARAARAGRDASSSSPRRRSSSLARRASTRLPAPPRPLRRRIFWQAGRAPVWADLLASAAQLRPVLVHGEFTMVSCWLGRRLTGIIDWETARVDHPFWDFDLGAGATRPQRRRRDSSALGARGWRAYAQARGLDVGSRPLETAFRLRHALRLLADPGDPAVDGTIEEHLAHL